MCQDRDIKNRILKIISEHVPDNYKDEVAEDLTLESLDLDAIDQIEILMRIEDYFSIEISDKEAEAFKDIQALIKCVEQKLSC